MTDHINLTGQNPLVGPNESAWGLVFRTWPGLRRRVGRLRAQAIAEALGWPLQKGDLPVTGPSLETPAEVRLLTTIGADAVGFSTVLEVITAVQAGMRVLGLSIITNVHTPDTPQPASVEEILAVAGQATPRLASVIRHVVEHLDAA